MKYLLFLSFLQLFFATAYCQDSVKLRGPFQPKSKYKNDVYREIFVNIRPEGDSAVIARINKRGAFNPMIQKDTFRANAIIATSKLNSNNEYAVVSNLTPINKNLKQNIKIILYGKAHKDSDLHVDSINFSPNNKELNLQKEQLLQYFKSVLNYMVPPDFYFHVGDTTSTKTIVPSNLFGARLNFIVTTIYKLIRIKKGIAYFDLNFHTLLDFSGKQQAIIIGSGSGSGEGNFTYDIKKGYFPMTESNLYLKAAIQFYNPSENEYIKLNYNEKTHSIIKNKKIR